MELLRIAATDHPSSRHRLAAQVAARRSVSARRAESSHGRARPVPLRPFGGTRANSSRLGGRRRGHSERPRGSRPRTRPPATPSRQRPPRRHAANRLGSAARPAPQPDHLCQRARRRTRPPCARLRHLRRPHRSNRPRKPRAPRRPSVGSSGPRLERRPARSRCRPIQGSDVEGIGTLRSCVSRAVDLLPALGESCCAPAICRC